MYLKAIDTLGQVLQMVGILLSAPGLWVEHWGILLERKVVRKALSLPNGERQ